MPYRCTACGGTFAEDVLGFVCEHFYERPAITYRPADQGAVPDTACTGCEAQRDDDPQTTIRLQPVCVTCYQRLCAARIRATDADVARGWALGGPAHYAALGKRPAAPIPAVVVGGHAKLTFAKIPSQPRDVEHMWIDVIERDGARVVGTLANTPQIITELTEGARIETSIDHVVDAVFVDQRVPLPGDHVCPMCTETDSPRKQLDDGDRKLLGHIRTLGWSYLIIPTDAEGPGWGFTVGLTHSFSHPELIITDLPSDTAKELIVRIASRIRAGERFEPGVAYPGLLEGTPCRFEPYDDPAAIKAHLGYALWFHRGAPFSVLHLTWSAETSAP